MASLRDELYALYKRVEAQEVFDAFKATEAKQAVTERDGLLTLFQLTNKSTPTLDSTCRHCDAPMAMCRWDDQYCSTCKGD